MKKIITILLFVVTISSNAQITLETTYPTGGVNYLRLVKLSSSGDKYVINDNTTITLYNLNHTVFKTITIPTFSTGINHCQIYYLSEELFNTNSADVEYFINYTGTTNQSLGHCAVVDELGNILFARDSTVISGGLGYGNEDFIVPTANGTKMIIWSNLYTNNNGWVYSLPGTLPCHDCTNGVTSSRTTVNNNLQANEIKNYPNPATNETTVAYSLPQGVTNADLVFYNITGQEVKRFKVTNAFKDILISTADLEAGTYYYQIQAPGINSSGKKMVVIK